MKRIPLTGPKAIGISVLVSDQDFDAVMDYPYRWQIGTHYIQARPTERGQNHILLHRFIMKPPAGLCVDHLDHDPFNCTRSNLRIVTLDENKRRSIWKTERKHDHAYGVFWSDHNSMWITFGRKGGRTGNSEFIGAFKSKEDAICARALFKCGMYVPPWKRSEVERGIRRGPHGFTHRQALAYLGLTPE